MEFWILVEMPGHGAKVHLIELSSPNFWARLPNLQFSSLRLLFVFHSVGRNWWFAMSFDQSKITETGRAARKKKGASELCEVCDVPVGWQVGTRRNPRRSQWWDQCQLFQFQTKIKSISTQTKDGSDPWAQKLASKIVNIKPNTVCILFVVGLLHFTQSCCK